MMIVIPTAQQKPRADPLPQPHDPGQLNLPTICSSITQMSLEIADSWRPKWYYSGGPMSSPEYAICLPKSHQSLNTEPGVRKEHSWLWPKTKIKTKENPIRDKKVILSLSNTNLEKDAIWKHLCLQKISIFRKIYNKFWVSLWITLCSQIYFISFCNHKNILLVYDMHKHTSIYLFMPPV